jgi:hypothetical protein
LIKTDANGNELWNRTFGQASAGWCQGCADDEANSVRITSDGGCILAGITKGSSPWLIKIDYKGDELWNKSYEDNSQFGAYSVEPTGDNGYILSGYSWLIKTDAQGNELWKKTFEPNIGLIHSVKPIPDNGYILVGSIDFGVTLIKTDARGNELWRKTFGWQGWANSVQPTPDGGYVLAGLTSSYGDAKAWLIKVAPG